jgi:hypothetical protein
MIQSWDSQIIDGVFPTKAKGMPWFIHKSVGRQFKLRVELTTLEAALNSNLDDGVRRLYEFMRRWLLADLLKLQIKEFNRE